MVCQMDPWGETTGGRLRLRLVIEALSRIGAIDLLVLTPLSPQSRIQPPPGSRVVRATAIQRPRPTRSLVHQLAWFFARRAPLELYAANYRAMHAQAAAWMDDDYTLVWVTRSHTYDAIRRVLPPAPVVVDVDDLTAEKISSELAGKRPRVAPTRASLLAWMHRMRMSINARRWKRYDRWLTTEVSASFVCSEGDRQRLGGTNVHVLPNGYRTLPRSSPATPSTNDGKTILMQGTLDYGPNLDAARFFIDDILPRILDRLPAVEFRMVGSAGDAAQRLHAPPRVTVTGFVEDLAPELARADLVVVPIRSGSGTRIKILEAWAHCIPVVSTSKGCEGLGARDDMHLKIADTADAFASACVAMLTDPELRRRTSEAALELFVERYSHDSIVQRTEDLARTIVSDQPPQASNRRRREGLA